VRHSCGENCVPQTFVAIKDGECVGTVALWNNDLGVRQDLTPWLACLYVAKEHRGQGVAAMLVDYCMAEAKRLGFEQLYLITELEGLYEKMGWRFVECAPCKTDGKIIRIYSRLMV